MFLVFIYSPLVFSNNMSIEQAKIKADESESNLEAKDLSRLLKAQTKMVNKIMPMCINLTGSQPTMNFVVVVKIEKNGIPNQSWLKGKYPLSLCFEKGMKEELFFIPKKAPFYSSFNYKFKP